MWTLQIFHVNYTENRPPAGISEAAVRNIADRGENWDRLAWLDRDVTLQAGNAGCRSLGDAMAQATAGTVCVRKENGTRRNVQRCMNGKVLTMYCLWVMPFSSLFVPYSLTLAKAQLRPRTSKGASRRECGDEKARFENSEYSQPQALRPEPASKYTFPCRERTGIGAYVYVCACLCQCQAFGFCIAIVSSNEKHKAHGRHSQFWTLERI